MLQFGYEQRNAASAGLLATNGLANSIQALKLSGNAHKCADIVIIHINANTNLAPEVSILLQTGGIRFDDREIAHLTRASYKVEMIPPADSGITKLLYSPLSILTCFLNLCPCT